MTRFDQHPRRRLRAFAAVLVLSVALGACQLAPPVAGSVLIACDQAANRITVTTDSHLDPDCVYTGGFDVTASDTTLDCQGATIHGPKSAGAGIVISAPVGSDLHDVTVKNCHVNGFMNGLKVTRPGFRDLPAGGEYEDDLDDIVITESSFTDTYGVGLYVDGYVTGVSVTHDTIRNAGSSGIYLETGSRGTTVAHNLLLQNGYRENGPGGQAFSFSGIDLWFWGVGREGISVDGSYQNTISDNIFWNDSNGGVLLYKNCGEYPDRDRYFERRYHADDNLITRNTFVDERNGVWVGSRMAENTLPMDCTDPAYIDEPLRRVVLDYAQGNTVSDNVFQNVTYGVRVEDDDNRITGNHFVAPSPDHHAVIVGTPLRNSVLGEPVTGTVVADNTSDIVDNPDPYRWIDGTTDTIDENNTALGRPTSVCPGVEPWRSQFIFVIAVAAAGPDGGPPATTPDITVPTLGALEPCAS
jgi:parallel beta-helix repeat protein